MDTSSPNETVLLLEYPASPPSPPRSPVPRSSLRLTSTINDPEISFIPTPTTPKSATFSPPPPSFSNPPPALPPRWLWRCHLCGISYPLGTTRRCLNDGHYFCAGSTVSKKTGRRKTHAPCGSTFDYIGWQQYGDWRRREQKLRQRAENVKTTSRFSAYLAQLVNIKLGGAAEDEDEESSDEEELDSAPPSSPRSFSKKKVTQNCEQGCNYPSECRWGARMGAKTEKKTTKSRKVKKESSTTIDAAPVVAEENAASAMDVTTEERDISVHQAHGDGMPLSSSNLAISQPQEEQKETLSSLQEFRLPKPHSRRRRSFSLPFSAYSLPPATTLESSGMMSPPSPPLSEGFGQEDLVMPVVAVPGVQDSVEDDYYGQSCGRGKGKGVARHRLLTPETTPEPVEEEVIFLAETVEHGLIVEETDSSSEGSRLSPPINLGDTISSSVLNWNWSIGGLTSTDWDVRRFSMSGEEFERG